MTRLGPAVVTAIGVARRGHRATLAGMDDLRAELRKAVDHARAGEWLQAHEIAQEHEGQAVANWIHAVVHRIEGDEDNAGYWYRRCGKDPRRRPSIEAELAEIAAALDASEQA